MAAKFSSCPLPVRLSIVGWTLLFPCLALSAPPKPLGRFEHHQDVGAARRAGSAIYDPAAQTYTVSSAGVNEGTATEPFHFAWTRLDGDFIIQASVRFVGASPRPQCQLGLMARDSLDAGSRHAAATVHGTTLSALQYRGADGAPAQVEVSSFHPTDIQLSRTGNQLTFSAAVLGENYKSVSREVALQRSVFAGLFVSCSDADVAARATFANVRVIIPAAPDFTPYRDYLGSHLEVMDVMTGHRTVLHSEPGSIQAPNWTRDDELIYNSAAGVMYAYAIRTGQIRELETGTYRQKDHVTRSGAHVSPRLVAGRQEARFHGRPQW
jgi:hypothetical protein